MFKQLLLVTIAAGLVTTAVPFQNSSAVAETMAGMPCGEAAKLKFPDDRKMRREWKKACKDAWKASQG